jgi:hypothetical protein
MARVLGGDVPPWTDEGEEAWRHKYDTLEWTCYFCHAEGRGVSNHERHLINKDWWDWVRRETALARNEATDLWVCRLGDARRPCQSERSFRGHLWHEHRWDWLDAWSCCHEVDCRF